MIEHNMGINGKTVLSGVVKRREGYIGDASPYYLHITFTDGTTLQMDENEIGVDFSKPNEGRTAAQPKKVPFIVQNAMRVEGRNEPPGE